MSDIVESIQSGFPGSGSARDRYVQGRRNEREAAQNVDNNQVNSEASQRSAADQAAAEAAARDKLLAIRLRKQNRSGTLLTTPEAGSETLG
jgi:hypothetical protein